MLRFKIKIGVSEPDHFCRRVRIHVKAISAGGAARSPHFFRAGFTLNECRPVMRCLEPPAPPPRPARKLCEPIDWRICGDHDVPPDE
jgi:hypothetical protein